MTEKRIKVYFNNNKQWLIFHVGARLRAFRARNDCHAYYIPAEPRLIRRGLFGHIYIPTGEITQLMFEELKSHEIAHAMHDWFLCRAGGAWALANPRGEELYASMTGQISKSFVRKYETYKKKGV